MSTIEINPAISNESLRALVSSSNAKVLSVTGSPENKENLAVTSRRDPNAKRILVELAKLGFLIYKQDDATSFFVRQDEVPALWHRVRTGELCATEDGVIFTFSPPLVASENPQLLVVFSSIHEDIYSASLGRYFKQNFPTLQKYVSPGTAVLRIADVGGITGAFYLDTTAAPHNSKLIQSLIMTKASEIGAARDAVVLYGGSKGATGALFHALSLGIRCVAVDPVVSDEYYESKYSDSHFTRGGIFPRTKQEVFASAVETYRTRSYESSSVGRIIVICSERSPQFEFIRNALIDPLLRRAVFFNCLHPDIRDHPDVGPKSLALTTTVINNSLYSVPMQVGLHPFV